MKYRNLRVLFGDGARADYLQEVLERARKELAELVVAVPRMQRRVVRDAHGKIEAVIEEPIG